MKNIRYYFMRVQVDILPRFLYKTRIEVACEVTPITYMIIMLSKELRLSTLFIVRRSQLTELCVSYQTFQNLGQKCIDAQIM